MEPHYIGTLWQAPLPANRARWWRAAGVSRQVGAYITECRAAETDRAAGRNYFFRSNFLNCAHVLVFATSLACSPARRAWKMPYCMTSSPVVEWASVLITIGMPRSFAAAAP